MADNPTQTPDAGKKPEKAAGPSVKLLIDELNAAEKREKNWRKEALEAEAIYESAKSRQNTYNILYSNTDTLQPALFNSAPRPIVRRRHRGSEDPVGKLAAEFAQKLLVYLIDDDCASETSFYDLMSHNVLSALLVSRGVTEFRYEGVTGALKTPEGTEVEDVLDSKVYGLNTSWNNFLHGYGKRWSQVPWIAFVDLLTKAEFEKSYPDAKVDAQKLRECAINPSTDEGTSDASSDSTAAVDKDEVTELSLLPVYRVWHKATKKVYFVSKFSDDWLRAPEDDPYELKGFFPIPEPLTFMQRLSGLVPVVLYKLYKEQAEELNVVTSRIRNIIKALKVRGAYDSNIDALAKILEADDNTMVPIADAAVLYAQNGSIDRALYIVPIENLVGVLQQLYAQRQQIKQVIFEITGIADIMRGSTQASETLGAQEIKNQWGTLRLKRMQKRVHNYVRDALRIMLEMAVTQIPQEQLMKMTGMQLPTKQMQMQAQQAVQMQQMQAQQAQMMAPEGAQPPQQPPQVDPQLQKILSTPSIDDVLGVLQNDFERTYRIDVETNSTIDAEATEDKTDIIEVLNAIGQFLAGVGPLVADGTLPFDAAKGMLLTVVQKFKLGDELEGYLREMTQPKPPGQEDGAAEQAKLEVEKAKVQAAQTMAQVEVQKAQQMLEVGQREHAMKLEMLARKDQLDKLKFEREMMRLQAEAVMPPAPPPAASAKPSRRSQ